jgi:hypothetical protein
LEKGCEVYRLYSDNTEGLCVDAKEIADHAAKGGMLGISKETSPRNTLNFRGFVKREVSPYEQSLAERKINRWKRERPRHCASGTVSGAFFRVLVMSQFI